jgi:hypothetical protein
MPRLAGDERIVALEIYQASRRAARFRWLHSPTAPSLNRPPTSTARSP